MTLGEYLCTVDAIMYAKSLEEIQIRIKAILQNPFIKNPDTLLKSLQLEARSLEHDYMNLKDLT